MRRGKSRRDLWRVAWDHPNGRDRMLGGAWDRETAEHMRDHVVAPSGMLNVRLVCAERGAREGE